MLDITSMSNIALPVWKQGTTSLNELRGNTGVSVIYQTAYFLALILEVLYTKYTIVRK